MQSECATWTTWPDAASTKQERSLNFVDVVCGQVRSRWWLAHSVVKSASCVDFPGLIWWTQAVALAFSVYLLRSH